MTVLFHNKSERNRFLKFSVVGAIGAVIDFGIFNILSGMFLITPVVASVFSFSAAVTSNFFWNRLWTYPDSRTKSIYQQLFQFTFINLIGLLIRTPLFAFLEIRLPKLFDLLELSDSRFLDSRFLGHNTALAIAVVVVMFWNFFANRYFTYNDVK